MAKVTVEKKNSNSVRVNFGDYASHKNINAKCRSYDIRDIVEIENEYDESFIEVTMRDAHGKRIWTLTYDQSYAGNQHFIVDSVDTGDGSGAQTPSNQQELFDLLEELRG